MRRVEVTSAHTPWVIEALGVWQRTRGWSLRGGTPSGAFLRRLQDDRFSRELVLLDSGRPAGLFEVTVVSETDGHGELDLLVDPALSAALRPELRSYLGDVFTAAPALRKLVVWSFADELDLPAYLGDLAQPAGRLAAQERRGHTTYVDQLVHELWREGALCPLPPG